MVSEVIKVIGINLRPAVLLWLGVCLLMPWGVQAQASAATAGAVHLGLDYYD